MSPPYTSTPTAATTESRSQLRSPSATRIWWLCVLYSMLSTYPLTAKGETPPEQLKAIEAIRGVRSNVQLNRDGTVRFVRFSKPVVTDDHMVALRAFEQLDYLAVVTPTVTDKGIASIRGLANLDTLNLAESSLTDQGMPHLEGLLKLQHLYLDNTSVTSLGIASLESLSRLETLSLDDTSIDDNCLSSLSQLSKLQRLSLRRTAVGRTPDGLQPLAQLSKLRVLHLDGLQLHTGTLQALTRLQELEELSLRDTDVHLGDLQCLAGHTRLRRVILNGTKLTRDDLPTLTEWLPKSQIFLDAPGSDRKSPWERLVSNEPLRRAKPFRQNKPATPASSPPASSTPLAELSDAPDFQRHIVPLFGRLGCNGRTCHGSFQGKGGFRLSMFGYDFSADHQALVAGDSPRINLEQPYQSLLLQHPTTEDHGGGVRFEEGGAVHQKLLDWIQAGARGVDGGPQSLKQLEVTPREIQFSTAGETVQLTVTAIWEDGLTEDVTHLARFQTNDDAVAEVSPEGLVTSRNPGDTWIISFYDTGVFQTQVLHPIGPPKTSSESEVGESPIDQFVLAKLDKLGIEASPICSDATFLRRVSLDIAGSLPSEVEVRAFIADPAPDKRARKIDELLQTPAYAQWWAMWLSDLTGSNAQLLGSTDMNRSAADQWDAWLLRRVQENTPWHRIAAGIILAESRRIDQDYDTYAMEQSSYLRRSSPEDFSSDANSMHYYWFRSNNQLPSDRALSFGYAFMGVRLQCAQCHKHPFDRWSKEDFDLFTQFFTRVKTGVADDAREAQRHLKLKLGVPDKLDTAALRRQMYQRVAAEGLPIPWNEIWISPPAEQPQRARLLGEHDVDLSEWRDPREPLMEWLLQEDNPYFAPSFVNRVWKRYFGRGLVDPADDFNLANPPSHPQLLDWLSREFVRQNYDMRWLHRTISNSKAYQRDWRPTKTNRGDERNFSRAVVRRLPAEVIVDAMRQATQSSERAATWSTEVRGRKIAFHPISLQAFRLDYSLLVFGKPLRSTNCDCERQEQPTLLQSLYVRNDEEIRQWLNAPDGWLAEVDEQSNSVEEVARNQSSSLVETAYLRTVGRLPTHSEMQRAQQYLSQAQSPRDGLRDLLWALLNSREFLTNH